MDMDSLLYLIWITNKVWHVQLTRLLCKDPGTSEKKIKNLTEKQVPDTSRHLTGICQ